MGVLKHILNTSVATILLTGVSFAEDADLDTLFERLSEPELENWETVENAIWREWSSSGSAAMDLLLQRGRDAMTKGNMEEAIGFFSTLIDHAPDFAEGWNARATAYFGADQYGLSIADIQRTLALNPRHFGAMQGLGRMLEELEDYDNALIAYRSAYAIHPHREGLEEAIERVEKNISGQDL
ncbi:MAG: tetratricopeptide repeat protein [Litoreibacter sp.]|nr:tetratricopeptide repeat protein [Litoreibacter sp.]